MLAYTGKGKRRKRIGREGKRENKCYTWSKTHAVQSAPPCTPSSTEDFHDQRPWLTIRNCCRAYKTKAKKDYDTFSKHRSDLYLLDLYKSFMKSAPQLVLQIYILFDTKDWRPMTDGGEVLLPGSIFRQPDRPELVLRACAEQQSLPLLSRGDCECRQLLSVEESGDRRPSQLLRHVPQLMSSYTTPTDEYLLRELFLQRLPGNVQMVIATSSTLDLHGLASLADKVLATPSVCNVTPPFNNWLEIHPASRVASSGVISVPSTATPSMVNTAAISEVGTPITSLVALAKGMVDYDIDLRHRCPDLTSLSWFGVILHLLWRLGIVTSRIGAMVLMAAVNDYWAIAYFGIHFVMTSIFAFTMTQDLVRREIAPNTPLWQQCAHGIAMGAALTFSFFNVADSSSQPWMIIMYTYASMQSAEAVVHFFNDWVNTGQPLHGMVAMAIVFGSFMLGLIAMLVYNCLYKQVYTVTLFPSRVSEADERPRQPSPLALTSRYPKEPEASRVTIHTCTYPGHDCDGDVKNWQIPRTSGIEDMRSTNEEG
ncbi:hypothetical protein HPB51_000506 [Rhipicephalus microplus]|uniref:XK-related protein n=1 Tax=Rhipicephalus microplus TaxID=6941 RepID=A0A9J6E5X4_RHIMP|nr:hypothetical protein HPB51_000506 [Rhipicephalus microplus]